MLSKYINKRNLIIGLVALLALVIVSAAAYIFKDTKDYSKSNSYLGLSETEAKIRARLAGLESIISTRDGKFLVVFTSCDPDAVALDIEKGKVKDASSGRERCDKIDKGLNKTTRSSE